MGGAAGDAAGAVFGVSGSGPSTITIERWPDHFDRPGSSVIALPDIYLNNAYFTYTTFLSNLDHNPYAFKELIPAQKQEEIDGTAKLVARGRAGNTTIAKGRALLNDVVDGAYLDGSISHFQTMVTKVDAKIDAVHTDDVSPKLGASPFVIGDPNPSNLAQTLSADNPVKYKNRARGDMFAKNYQAERTRQAEVLPVGVRYSDQEIADAEMVRRGGVYDREYRQTVNEDIFRMWTEASANRIKAIEVYGNALRSLVGAREAHTQPYYRPNPAGAIVGGAVVGATAGSVIPGVGTGVGAVVGGVLGLLSTQ